MDSDLFFRVAFHDKMGDNIKRVLDHVSQAEGIAYFQEHIINRSQINIFNTMSFHVLEDTSVFHFGVNCTVASWSERNLALGFDDDFAIVTNSRNTSLREENYGVRVVTEVIVGFEIVDHLIVVHFACHNVPLDHVGVCEG